jgi:hypothetical protein
VDQLFGEDIFFESAGVGDHGLVGSKEYFKRLR